MTTSDMHDLKMNASGYLQNSQVSSGFLQTVIDALPGGLIVVDRDFNVVLANQTARNKSCCKDVETKTTKCYQCFHGRKRPCSEEDPQAKGSEMDCPVQHVFETGVATRVYHTHYDENGKAISVAVDAAPILNDAGEVMLVIETCRDVTERSLSRRLLRIGNRHMKMKPLLEEYAAEIRQFTGCAKVGIHILEEVCEACPGSGFDWNPGKREHGCCEARTTCICVRLLNREIANELPPATRCGSLRFDHLSEFVAAIADPRREQLGAFSWPECESLALIPIQLGDMNVGLLHVADPRPKAISATTVESLERLSLELATAIHRVRIEEALRSTRDELESRVTERTAALTKSNQALQSEIGERVRLEREILQVSVREQQRIGQELHDGLGQELTGLSYLAQNLLLTLRAKGAPEVEMAAELASSIPQALGQIQKIVRGLVPLEIGAADLEIALDVLTSNVAKLTGVACHFNPDGCDLINDDDAAIQIYRIAQEAITNAVKHAQASVVEVSLGAKDDLIRLEIVDDGVGIPADAEKGPGCGLRSMSYRARAIGGEFSIRRRPSGGTLVTCTFSQAPNGADANGNGSNRTHANGDDAKETSDDL